MEDRRGAARVPLPQTKRDAGTSSPVLRAPSDAFSTCVGTCGYLLYTGNRRFSRLFFPSSSPPPTIGRVRFASFVAATQTRFRLAVLILARGVGPPERRLGGLSGVASGSSGSVALVSWPVATRRARFDRSATFRAARCVPSRRFAWPSAERTGSERWGGGAVWGAFTVSFLE